MLLIFFCSPNLSCVSSAPRFFFFTVCDCEMVAAADESPAPHRKRTTDSQRGEEKKKKTRKRNKNNETPIHHGFKVRASFVFEKKKKIAKNAVCVLGQVGHQQR